MPGVRRKKSTRAPRGIRRVVAVASKKVYRRRKLGSLKRVFPDYGNFPLPPFKFFKLGYTDEGSISVGSSGVLGSVQKYNLNSVFDPDVTNAGHQPSGFDQIANFYYRYKVVGCKIQLSLFAPTADNFIGVMSVRNPSAYSTSIAGMQPAEAAELQQSSTMFYLSTTGKREVKKTFYVPISQISGLTKLQFRADPDNFTAPVTANPGNLCGFEFAIADAANGSSGSCRYHIRLTYYTQFYQRKILPQS